MGFNPGSNVSISGADDVALSNPANDQTLVYDGSVQLWRNGTQSGAPTGGATDQVLAKASDADHDMTWSDSVPLSDTAPPASSGAASAGTMNEAARADHQHAIVPSLGYAIRSGMFSSPIGIPNIASSNNCSVGKLTMAPLPVMTAMTIDTVQVYTKNTGSVLDLAIYDSSPATRMPRTRIGTVSTHTVTSTGFNPISVSPSLLLAPGVYWVGILVRTSSLNFAPLQIGSVGTHHMLDHGYDTGNRLYTYANGGSGYSSPPSSLLGIEPAIDNDGMIWYQVRTV